VNLAELLANPYFAFALRFALGAYIVFMARGFYADPLDYFRRWMPNLQTHMQHLALASKAIRALACFCIWGGCFIIASAIAAQLLDLHGYGYALLIVLLAATATYFLLPPQNLPPSTETRPKIHHDGRLD